MTIKFKYWSKYFYKYILINIPFSDNADMILLGLNKSSNDLLIYLLYILLNLSNQYSNKIMHLSLTPEQQYIFSISSYFIYSTSINL